MIILVFVIYYKQYRFILLFESNRIKCQTTHNLIILEVHSMKLIDKLSRRQLLWVSLSFIVMAVTSVISAIIALPLFWTIVAIILSEVSSCFFFPIVVGQMIDQEKSEHDFGVINNFYQDFSEGGIIQVYKDREQSSRADNGETALKRAFEEHVNGEIKLIGVTLRVFFNQTGPFFNDMESLCIKSKILTSIRIKALISTEDAPETINRGNIESPGEPIPTIITEMNATKQYVSRLNSKAGNQIIELRDYSQAPYCTAIIFPDKCFISQNLLCDTAPVRLPLIIFRKESHGYKVINDYFEYLWHQKNKQDDKKDDDKKELALSGGVRGG